jgi:hypothetical protein
MRLCSAQGRPFSRHAGRARGRRGWYILCPEVPKLLKALWPAVPARSAPARLRHRRLADALGAARWHDSAAAQSLHGRLPCACHLPVTVSRTESSLWVDWSGGFVPWHLSCESIAQLENAPASPEARVFFPAETQPFVLGGIKMNCASKFIATCRSHGLRQAPHSIKSRCGILSGSLEGFPRDQPDPLQGPGQGGRGGVRATTTPWPLPVLAEAECTVWH